MPAPTSSLPAFSRLPMRCPGDSGGSTHLLPSVAEESVAEDALSHLLPRAMGTCIQGVTARRRIPKSYAVKTGIRSGDSGGPQLLRAGLVAEGAPNPYPMGHCYENSPGSPHTRLTGENRYPWWGDSGGTAPTSSGSVAEGAPSHPYPTMGTASGCGTTTTSFVKTGYRGGPHLLRAGL